jgi:hypothetical protein
MAKRAMMMCPLCRKVGQPEVELFTENPEVDVFRCANQAHAFPNYLQLMEMNPDKIKLIPQEKPQPGDVKVEFWIDKEIVSRFEAMYPNQKNATVSSILSCFLYGAPIIIDGVQAKKLNEYGVKTGAEVLSTIEVGRGLEAELAATQEKLSFIQGMLRNADIGAMAE